MEVWENIENQRLFQNNPFLSYIPPHFMCPNFCYVFHFVSMLNKKTHRDQFVLCEEEEGFDFHLNSFYARNSPFFPLFGRVAVIFREALWRQQWIFLERFSFLSRFHSTFSLLMRVGVMELRASISDDF